MDISRADIIIPFVLLVVATIGTIAFFRIFLIISPNEGEIIPIAKENDLDHFIDNVPGWHLEEINGEPMMVEGDRDPDFLEKYLGWFIMGLIPFIYRPLEFEFEWDELEASTSDGDGYTIKHHKEMISSIYFQHPYAIRLQKQEGRDRESIEIKLLVTTRIIYPKRLFKVLPVGVWFKIFRGIIESIVKQYVSGKSYDELLRESSEETSGGNNLVSKLLDQSVQDKLLKSIGIKIAGAELLQVNLENKGELADAQTAEKVADLEGKAKIITAKAAAEAEKAAAEGQAAAIERIAKAKRKEFEETEVFLREALGEEAYKAYRRSLTTGTVVEGGGGVDPKAIAAALAMAQSQNPPKK